SVGAQGPFIRPAAPYVHTRRCRSVPPRGAPMSVYKPRRADGTPKTRIYQFDFKLTPKGKHKPERFFGSTGQRTEAAAKRVENEFRELAKLGKLNHRLTVGGRPFRNSGVPDLSGSDTRGPQAARTKVLIFLEKRSQYATVGACSR